MSQLFANRARSPLMADILAADTSITVDVALADLYPVANTGTDPVPTVGKDFFKITLQKTNGDYEIVYVRTRAAGVATFSNVLRGQEGTTAKDFLTGSIVGLRHTAADLAGAIDLAANATTAGKALLNAATAAAQRVVLGFSTYFSSLIGIADVTAFRTALGISTFFTTLIGAASLAAFRILIGLKPVPRRQTVLSSVVTSGLPTFMSTAASLNLPIAATAVPIVLTAANGFDALGQVDRVGAVSADTTVALTNNATNFVYGDIDAAGVVTLAATVLAPVYQWGGTYSIAPGQFTFNKTEMVGKVGNGAAAVQTHRVFLGEAVTAGGVITSVVNYALMGRYESDWVATLPAGGSTTTKNHDLGLQPEVKNLVIECTTINSTYTVGQRLHKQDLITLSATSNFRYPLTLYTTPLLMSLTVGAGAVEFGAMNGTGGDFLNLTRTSWKYKFTASRGW